jgi:hypothetical protein
MPAGDSMPDLSWLADAPIFIDSQQIKCLLRCCRRTSVPDRRTADLCGPDRAAGEIGRRPAGRWAACFVSLAETDAMKERSLPLPGGCWK